MRTVIIIILAGIVLVGGALTYVFLQPTDCGEDAQCITDALLACNRAKGTITYAQTQIDDRSIDPEEFEFTVHGKPIVRDAAEEITETPASFKAEITIRGTEEDNCNVEFYFIESSNELLAGKHLTCSIPPLAADSLEDNEDISLNSIDPQRCTVA